MTFVAPGHQYERFVGRYLPTLAPAFADAAGIVPGMRVVDVGCGPGGLTRELRTRLGADSVAAIDPSPPFVEACRASNPGVDVRDGVAESLPFPDDDFDAALASLVVAFMHDAQAGVREMSRVTRSGGVVAASMWDRGEGGMPMLDVFWSAAATIDPDVHGERAMLGTEPGQLDALLERAGLADVEGGELWASAHYESFDDWWEPFTFGIGPAGSHYQSLDEGQRERLRLECRRRLDQADGAFTLEARAWFARARVP